MNKKFRGSMTVDKMVDFEIDNDEMIEHLEEEGYIVTYPNEEDPDPLLPETLVNLVEQLYTQQYIHNNIDKDLLSKLYYEVLGRIT